MPAAAVDRDAAKPGVPYPVRDGPGRDRLAVRNRRLAAVCRQGTPPALASRIAPHAGPPTLREHRVARGFGRPHDGAKHTCPRWRRRGGLRRPSLASPRGEGRWAGRVAPRPECRRDVGHHPRGPLRHPCRTTPGNPPTGVVVPARACSGRTRRGRRAGRVKRGPPRGSTPPGWWGRGVAAIVWRPRTAAGAARWSDRPPDPAVGSGTAGRRSGAADSVAAPRRGQSACPRASTRP